MVRGVWEKETGRERDRRLPGEIFDRAFVQNIKRKELRIYSSNFLTDIALICVLKLFDKKILL